MIDDIRPIARVIHFAFSLLAALVVYCLTWYTLQDTTTRWRLTASLFFALCAALLAHGALDWLVGVP